jgi:hypothetical protein
MILTFHFSFVLLSCALLSAPLCFRQKLSNRSVCQSTRQDFV